MKNFMSPAQKRRESVARNPPACAGAASLLAFNSSTSNPSPQRIIHQPQSLPMPTELLFRDDAYLFAAPARVVAVNGQGGIILDRTPFYATGGGQPGDAGLLRMADGRSVRIATAIHDPEDRSRVIHVPAEGESAPQPGEAVTAEIDSELRLKRMRIHTALHLLSVVLPFPVTGGSIGDGEGRLDFDIQDAGLDRDDIASRLNALIMRDAPVTDRWITDEELDANPGLVKTMSVKPPRGSGKVRLVAIEGIDLQPCGGTHVRGTGEIGPVTVTSIEKKGKQNRRVRIALA
jgi:misacylated tRNA(Ala) deacylase